MGVREWKCFSLVSHWFSSVGDEKVDVVRKVSPKCWRGFCSLARDPEHLQIIVAGLSILPQECRSSTESMLMFKNDIIIRKLVQTRLSLFTKSLDHVLNLGVHADF